MVFEWILQYLPTYILIGCSIVFLIPIISGMISHSLILGGIFLILMCLLYACAFQLTIVRNVLDKHIIEQPRKMIYAYPSKIRINNI